MSGYRRGSGPGRRAGLAVLRHRRLLTVALVLAAVWVTVRAAAPPRPATAPVLVAARDLAAGATIGRGDLRPAAWTREQVPASALGAASAATGKVLAGPLAAGELVTAQRLLGPGLLTGQPAGTVAVTIRPAEAADLSAVAAGDRVDVLAGAAGDGLGTGGASPWAGAQTMATSALVLAALTPGTEEDGGMAGALGGPAAGPSGDGGALVLGVDPATASRLAAARTARPLTLVVRAPVAAPGG